MSSDGHDGIIWILGCLIVLTLSGVLLSILVDKRFSFQRQTNSLQSKVNAGEESIRDRRNQIHEAKASLAAASARASRAETDLVTTKAAGRDLSERVKHLESRKKKLTLLLTETREAFHAYRERYKKHTWESAVGEKFDYFFLRTGQQYDRVIITKVTSNGLEISHDHGLARIDGRDLSQALQAQFQWFDNDEGLQGSPRAAEFGEGGAEAGGGVRK